MKLILSFLIIIALLFSACSTSLECPKGINLLPMYGKGSAKKCKAQLESDAQFLAECDKTYSSRKEASLKHLDQGWYYFYNGDLDTAMKRFNQAWLLDNENMYVQWAFGAVLAKQHKSEEAIKLLNKYIAFDTKNTKAWLSLSDCYLDLYNKTQNRKYISQIQQRLKFAIGENVENKELKKQLETINNIQ